MPPLIFNPTLFIAESFFTLITIILCLIIFLKTKESYDLTKHQGIKLFRNAFVFFGLSYLLRFIFMISRTFMDNGYYWREIMPYFILVLGYLSTTAIFYLLFSIIRKKFNQKSLVLIGHIIAVLISLLAFAMMSHLILLYIQSLLLILVIIISFIIHQKKSLIKTIYVLILIFWLINLWVIAPGWLLPVEVKILFQIISIILFVWIYYKISKWLK